METILYVLGVVIFVTLAVFVVFHIITIRIKPKDGLTNVDSLVGKTGFVTKAIDEFEPGYVRVSFQEWKAASKESLVPGDEIKVVAVNGNKLIVKKNNKEMC